MTSFLKITLTLILACLFTQLSAADYFWIGGTGNWSEISHWATSSGGAITHSQVPTANDDVYFDANSFTAAGQTVTLNTTIVFCHNMSWTGVTNNPTLLGTDNVIISAFGSWLLNPAMTFDFNGRIEFLSNQVGNTVNFNSHSSGKDILFSGTGEWTLTNDIAVDSAFVFNEGTLNTNGQAINCRYFESKTNNNRSLNLGSSNLTISGNTLNGESLWFNIIKPLQLNAENLSLDAATSTITFTGDDTQIWLENTGSLHFNRVVFNNPMGSTHLRLWVEPGDLDPSIPDVSYNELELFHIAQLDGDIEIDNLILHPNQVYSFESGKTFAIDNISATGDCIAGITLQSTEIGTNSTFEISSNTNIDFVSIRDITVTGTGIATANNAVDLGNTAGWTINARPSSDFYWIGNTGNWDDPTHWSFSSGGTSSGCIPSSQDDVFFDANSFNMAGQIVTINVENAYCRNMSWMDVDNLPEFTGAANNNIHIAASLDFISNMNHSFQGDYYFESDQLGNTITTAGQAFNDDVNFSGINGGWIFQDSIYIHHNMNLLSGAINTNDQYVDIYSFYALTDFPRSLILGNSYIKMTNRFPTPSEWELNATNLNLNTGTSTIEVFGEFSNLFRNYGNGNIVYNNIIFNCFGGRLFSDIEDAYPIMEIDSLIFLRNGFIAGENKVNYWSMQAGHTYDFTLTSTQVITELNANGNCSNGLIYIQSANPGQATTFDLANDHTFERLYISGINQIGTGLLTANNSIDGEFNGGWIINEATPTTLYWIGGEGNWQDQAHWSYSSGGIGGACIPTPADDVIFDQNSFPLNNATVSNTGGSTDVYCNNITWTTNITTNPLFSPEYINIYGSLSIESPSQWNLSTLIYFRGDDQQFIYSDGIQLSHIAFECSGTYTLSSPLLVRNISMRRGIFDTNNYDVEALRFTAIFQQFEKEVILGSSQFLLTEGTNSGASSSFYNQTTSLTLQAGTSTIELSGLTASLNSLGDLNFNKLLFSNPSSQGYITTNSNFSHIQFNGYGTISGSNTTDTLICAAGKAYVFEASETQIVHDYWKIIGNNCTPIGLSSNMNGALANVSMPAASDILADFIQMQDINAFGGGDFLAGVHSTNISNSNIGWVFETAPELIDVGFLGADVALCFGEPITLDAYNFSAGETYLWQNNSTDSTLIVDQSGIYSVEVTFLNNCIIQDTIEVLSIENFNVDIIDDPDICSGETIVLETGINLNTAAYLWQDGSTESTFEADTAGEYFVQVDFGGCIGSDTTILSLTNYPSLDLGEDLSACEGETFDLETSVMAETYLWQDGSDLNHFTGNTAGIYWLEAANGDCAVRDSVTLNYVSATSVDIGADTLLCDQTDFLLELNIPNASYEWQDGSTNNTFNTNQSGEYWAIATLDGCAVADTIQLTFQDNPSIEIDDEIMGCQGDLIEINTTISADAFQWSDGDMDANFSTNQAGQYFLEATFGECIVRENFEIVLHQIPIITPLGEDESICDGDVFALEALTDIGAIEWQDGSINPVFNVNSSGEYWFTADNEGCINADTININVISYPILNLGEDINVCEGETFDLQTSETAETFLWQDGSDLNHFTGNTAGIYWLEAANGNCAVRDSVTVSYISATSVDIGVDTLLCDQTDFLLELNIIDATYEWQDGSTNNTFNANQSGEYWAIATLDGCAVADTIQLTFQDNPSIELDNEMIGCQGDLIEINTTISADAYEWSDGDMDANFSTNQAGQYFLEATFGECIVRENFEVILHQIPIITPLGEDESICDGDIFTLEALTDIGTIEWQDGSNNNTFDVNTSGLYWFIADNEGCTSSDTISIDILPSPMVSLGEDQQACEGDSISLTPSEQGLFVFWEDGSNTIPRILTTAGEYWIEIENSEGCLGRDSVLISFASKPTLELGKDTTVCEDQPYVIRPQFNEGQLLWPDGSTQNTFLVENPGKVVATLNNNGCISTDTVHINFQECHYFEAYIPNVFSPNKDGINDGFKPFFDPSIEILDYSMNIYNRWGGHVFTTNDMNASWKATNTDEQVETGVYIYAIEVNYRDDLGENKTVLKGDVTVIR